MTGMTLDEVANYLKISKSLVRKLCVTDNLPHVRLGTRYLFSKEDLEAWLDARKVGQSA